MPKAFYVIVPAGKGDGARGEEGNAAFGMATLFRTHSLRCLCKVVFLFLRAFRPVL